MSDLRDIAVKYAHLLSAPEYSKLLDLADEIERLKVVVNDRDSEINLLRAEIERLQHEIEAAMPHSQQRRFELNRQQDEIERLEAMVEAGEMSAKVKTDALETKDAEIERLRDRNKVLEQSAEINRKIMDSYGPRFDEYDNQIAKLQAALHKLDGQFPMGSWQEEVIDLALETDDGR